MPLILKNDNIFMEFYYFFLWGRKFKDADEALFGERCHTRREGGILVRDGRDVGRRMADTVHGAAAHLGFASMASARIEKKQ